MDFDFQPTGILIYKNLRSHMYNDEYTEEQLSEMREDAFVNIKEACMRLQERTKCSNEIVIKMLNEVSQFYITQDEKNSP